MHKSFGDFGCLEGMTLHRALANTPEELNVRVSLKAVPTLLSVLHLTKVNRAALAYRFTLRAVQFSAASPHLCSPFTPSAHEHARNVQAQVRPLFLVPLFPACILCACPEPSS